MQLGMVGLGRMGAKMARRLMRAGHRCVVYDADPGRIFDLVKHGAFGADSLEDLTERLSPPRIVWLMLPAGEVTGRVIQDAAELLSAGDVLVDGGNSRYTDDISRGAWLRNRGIELVDCGTSGGIHGEERGYCLTIGGSRETVVRLDPIFAALAPGGNSSPPVSASSPEETAPFGYLHCGPVGAGHFVKMVHNGIEYGLMQAYAEGFDLLQNANRLGYRLPVADIAEVWRHGSVIMAWLLDLVASSLARSPELAGIEGRVADSGEGRWAVEASVQAGVPCPALTAALFARFRSQVDHTFAEKVLAAMRLGFGGHVESRAPVAI